MRCLSGLVFMVVMAAGLLVHPTIYALLFMLITGITTLEYFRVTVKKRHIFAQCAVILGGWMLFILFYLLMRFHIPAHWFLLMVLPPTAVWISLLYQKEEYAYQSAPWLFIPLLYIAFPFALTNILVFDGQGLFSGTLLLDLFIMLWASDVGAYIFGMAFGQKRGHKLFPRLSPKKSWEGFFGGLVTAMIAGYFLYLTHLMPYHWAHCLAIPLMLHGCGVWGDLAESQLKRHFEIKDSGKIMPGHGGLLDRFDSALLAFPMAIAYLQIITLFLPS